VALAVNTPPEPAARTRARGQAASTPSHVLTARIAAGDEHAFAAFYELWFDRLLAMARVMTRRDEAFCLDVVHDCMLRVVRKLPALASEDAVAAWLARTLLRGAVDRLRQEKRRARREADVVAGSTGGTDDPHTDLFALEQRAWLQARLDELPAPDRTLLLARFAEGKTLAGVGHALGVTGDAAHGRIRRLLQRLRSAAQGVFDA
jgi:RNA polymerase sigma factor (sigma-70 family)